MLLFGFLFTAFGAFIFYLAYKKKFIKTKEGETLSDFQTGMLKKDPNEAVKTSLGIGLSAYFKMMGFVGGVIFMISGILIMLLSTLW